MKTTKLKFILPVVLSLFLIFSLTACGTSEQKTDINPQTEPDTTEEPEETEPSSYGELSEGDTAPEFTASLADGTDFTLSKQQGKIVLLNFWATWCGPCVREMPAFEMLYEEYGENLAILAVNCMEDADTVAAFIEENGYTFPIALDTEGAVCMKYPSQGIPYTLVIDGDGVIQNIFLGAADADVQYEEYKNAIDALSE